jgi:putative transposase
VHEYETPREATQGLRRYFEFSNGQRLHQALAYRTPAAVSVGNTA